MSFLFDADAVLAVLLLTVLKDRVLRKDSRFLDSIGWLVDPSAVGIQRTFVVKAITDDHIPDGVVPGVRLEFALERGWWR